MTVCSESFAQHWVIPSGLLTHVLLTIPRAWKNAPALYALLEPAFARAGNAEWIERLDAADVPCAPVQDLPSMLEHPQTKALGLMQHVPGNSIPMMGLPLRLDGVRPQPRHAAPALGEANQTLPRSAE